MELKRDSALLDKVVIYDFSVVNLTPCVIGFPSFPLDLAPVPKAALKLLIVFLCNTYAPFLMALNRILWRFSSLS